jgi:hypothetical protein
MLTDSMRFRIALQVQIRTLKALQAIQILQGLNLAGTLNLKPIKHNEAKRTN